MCFDAQRQKETMTSAAAQIARDYRGPERRIAWLTLAIGTAASAAVAVGVSWRAGAGVLLGALLAWVNLRWLQEALDALVRLSKAQQGASRPRISTWVYMKFFGRYALIALITYVIVTRFAVPVLSVLGGLCALGAAAMAGSVYELIAKPD